MSERESEGERISYMQETTVTDEYDEDFQQGPPTILGYCNRLFTDVC